LALKQQQIVELWDELTLLQRLNKNRVLKERRKQQQNNDNNDDDDDNDNLLSQQHPRLAAAPLTPPALADVPPHLAISPEADDEFQAHLATFQKHIEKNQL
jgi:hypothetical protein